MKKLTLFLFISILAFATSKAQEIPLKGNVLFGSLQARQIGPAVMGGRIADLDGVASDPKVFYVGSAGGGVWKTKDGGTTFRDVFEKYTQSIGAISIDQNHPDTVWVGTGECWVRNSVSVGTGVYKTMNGGQEWKSMGLEKTERISSIIVHPQNPNTVFVGAMGGLWNANPERGVYKTTDGGKTWEKVLFVDENTGCADMAMHPDNPNIIFASMWEYRRSPDFFKSGGKSSALYKSMDGGNSWSKVEGGGLPSVELGRIAVAIAPSNPQVVYATIEADKEERGLYKSTDGGSSWEKINNTEFNVTIRPFYFSRIVIDPKDENIIYKAGLNLVVSKDGGKSFRTVSSGMHSDIHDVWVNPQNTNIVYAGTDGGVYRSLDKAYYFAMLKNLPVSQFYRVSVDDAEPYNIYGGLQDNGSWVGPSQSPNGVENRDWTSLFGGDGFYVFRHPTDENTVYVEYQGGNLGRYDKRTKQVKQIKPYSEEGQEDLRFNWNTPIHVSPNNPERLYYGSQYLHLSEDRGESWLAISPDLTSNDANKQNQGKSGGITVDNSSAENHTTIYAIAESPANESIIWVGTDDGNLQVTENSGGKWKNVAKNVDGLPKSTWVSYVEPSSFNLNTAYVTFDGHRSGDKKTYLYKTTDLGKSWTSLVTEDIKGYAQVIVEDLVNPNLLFLGTEFGLYISVDGGQNWSQFTNNMPPASVRDMVIHPRENALVMATHGRGIIIIDDITPLRQITPEMLEETVFFFESEPVTFANNTGFQDFPGAGEFVGANPSEVAQIIYYMKKRHTFGKMTMEIYNEAGEKVTTLTPGKESGINIVEWATRLKAPKTAPTDNIQAIGGSLFGPTIPEGTYTVKLIKDKDVYESKVILQADPNSIYSVEDRRVQQITALKLYELTEQLAYIYYTLENIEKQASKQAEEGSSMNKELKSLAEEIKEYKNSLVGLGGDGYVDTKSQLRERISNVYGAVNNYAGRPSQSQIDETELLEVEMQKAQEKLEEFKSKAEKLNEKLKSAGETPLKVQTFEEFKEEK